MHLFDAEAPVGPQENDARNLISPAGAAPR
jgi:hypothetical protein